MQALFAVLLSLSTVFAQFPDNGFQLFQEAQVGQDHPQFQSFGNFHSEQIQPEPLPALPGLATEPQSAGPPGFAPPAQMIRTLRRESSSNVGFSKHGGRMMGISRHRPSEE